MRILTILVRTGIEKNQGAAEDVASLFARQMPRVRRELVIVDNALPQDYQQGLGPSGVLIGGSGAHREFSAWDSGLNCVRARLHTYDFVHLVTSAFRALYTRYLERFNEDMLGLVLHRAAAVAHIDYYNEPVTVLGRRSQAWLRTSFLFVPPAELRMLGSLVSMLDPSALFSGNPEVPFRDEAPISKTYRGYLLSWLTGDGTGQGVEWHSRFALSPETLPLFESKALAVLNEHLLSIRLRAQGCAMVDATWLATRAKALAPGEPLGPIPSWRKQLIERDTDPVPAKTLFD